jgi:ribosomal protein S18 acetylase RimI-like enzyme
MNIEIRDYLAADKKRLFKLFCDLIEYNSEKSGDKDYWLTSGWNKERRGDFERALSIKNRLLLVLTVDEKIEGYLLAFYIPEENICILEELYIAPEFRKHGFGTKLVNKCLEWSRGLNMPIKVEVYPWNEYAKTWYRQFGFKLESFSYVIE